MSGEIELLISTMRQNKLPLFQHLDYQPPALEHNEWLISRLVEIRDTNKTFHFNEDNLVGSRFGRLLVSEYLTTFRLPCGKAEKTWICTCDCGTRVVTYQSRLTHRKISKSKSCGCEYTERFSLSLSMASYLAGLIDGEGCLSLTKMQSNTRDRRGFHYAARLAINMTGTFLEGLYERIPIGHHIQCGKRSSSRKPNWKPISSWYWGAKHLRILLPQIYPYLILKKPQGALLWDYMVIAMHFPRGIPEYYEAYKMAQDEIFEKMRRLNKRGVEPCLMK